MDIYSLDRIITKTKPKSLLRNLKIFLDLLKCMQTYPLRQYFYLRGKAGRTLSVRIKDLGEKSVKARTGTVDYATLISVFYEKYHLPPRELTRNPTILDLGCNTGYTLIHFKYLYPDSKIIGVEMDKDNFELARVNTEGLTDCHLLNMAVSTKDGVVKYDKNSDVDAYHIQYTNGENEKKLAEIESITIKSIINKFKLECIEYVKMDIEGEEINIFDNDLSWLNIVKMMNIEVHGSQSDLNKIMIKIKKHNFQVWKGTKHLLSIMATKN